MTALTLQDVPTTAADQRIVAIAPGQDVRAVIAPQVVVVPTLSTRFLCSRIAAEVIAPPKLSAPVPGPDLARPNAFAYAWIVG